MNTQNLYFYRAILRAVYDGDTVTLDIDLGFRQWMLGRSVRLYGLNAPELHGADREAGLASRDFLRETCPIGTEILLESILDRQEKYGRLLGRLHLGDGRCVNDLILAKGLAR
ncbi:MAG: thermonuclease family protein [Paracoccaceae bacterium]